MFPNKCKLFKYRYENDANSKNHSPLKEFSLKDLVRFSGLKAQMSLLMADQKKSISKYAKLYLTKLKEGFIEREDNSIEWIINPFQDILKFDFIGIQIFRGARRRLNSYEETNSYIRLTIYDGEKIRHKETSMIIRDTKLSKNQKMQIASTDFATKSGDTGQPSILTIHFVKQLPYYETEFKLCNGEQSIDAYNPSKKLSPCLKVAFDLQNFTNGYNSLTLRNIPFAKRVVLNNLILKCNFKEQNFEGSRNSLVISNVETIPDSSVCASTSYGYYQRNNVTLIPESSVGYPADFVPIPDDFRKSSDTHIIAISEEVVPMEVDVDCTVEVDDLVQENSGTYTFGIVSNYTPSIEMQIIEFPFVSAESEQDIDSIPATESKDADDVPSRSGTNDDTFPDSHSASLPFGFDVAEIVQEMYPDFAEVFHQIV